MSTILEKGRYKIPQGCVVDVFRNEIIVRESRANRRINEGRFCRYCKHFALGHNHVFHKNRKCHVCLLRPEKEQGWFCSVNMYQEACDKFEQREED